MQIRVHSYLYLGKSAAKPQAYIKKGRIAIQVFPVPNAYTTSFVVCSCTL